MLNVITVITPQAAWSPLKQCDHTSFFSSSHTCVWWSHPWREFATPQMQLNPITCSLKNENLWFLESPYIVYSEGGEELKLNKAII